MARARDGSRQASVNSGSTELVTVLGYILTVSYPLLALSTGVRAMFQLVLKEGVVNFLAPTLSLAAAVCYLTATIGFAYRRRLAWRISVGVLLFETVLTLLVGSLSLIIPEAIGRTVWRHFGADYGYFPPVSTGNRSYLAVLAVDKAAIWPEPGRQHWWPQLRHFRDGRLDEW